MEPKPVNKRVPPHRWKPAFILSYRDTGNVRLSAAKAGIDRSTYYRALDSDPKFAAAAEEARQESIDILEARAREGATVGFEETLFFQGEVVTTVRRVHPGLLMFLLKSLRREVYGDKIETTGKDGAAQEVHVVHTINPDLLTTEELHIMRKAALRIEGKEEA